MSILRDKGTMTGLHPSMLRSGTLTFTNQGLQSADFLIVANMEAQSYDNRRIRECHRNMGAT